MIEQTDSAHLQGSSVRTSKNGENVTEEPITMEAVPSPVTTIPSPPKNLLDLNRLRLSQDFNAVSVKKALLTVPVRKPSKEWWIQTHPDPAFKLDTVVLELKEENETYLVDPALWSDLAAESTVSARALFTAVNSVGVCFIWPIRLPGDDGKLDDWNRSALEAADQAAKGSWIRVQSNRSLGAYDVSIADFSKPPVWPIADLSTLIQKAFKDKYIDNIEHPVLKRLRGEK